MVRIQNGVDPYFSLVSFILLDELMDKVVSKNHASELERSSKTTFLLENLYCSFVNKEKIMKKGTTNKASCFSHHSQCCFGSPF